jgi:AraC-like DNA-binding protein
MPYKHHTDPELRRALERWLAAEDSDLSRVDAVRIAAEVRRLADQVLDQRVLEARAHNWSWAKIARAVGITRQSAHRRWRHLEAPARALAEEKEKRFRSSRWPPDAPWIGQDG